MFTLEQVRSEIASAGTIRAAVNMSNAALIRWDETAGALVGLSAEIADRIARELDRGLSLIRYGSAADILSAADGGEWDIAFIASDPSRTDRFSFSPPYISVEATYLVPVTSPYRTADELDTNGIRIASARSAAYTKQLERTLKRATVLHVDNPAAAVGFLVDQECDAAAGLTEFLFNASERMEGFRVVDGVFSRIPQTIAVHKRATNASLFFADFVRRLGGADAGEEKNGVP
ncbi:MULTISPECIES: transporter substrate-binding domain-containing protein [Rhizobium]|uniref:Polar amino acid transport system substrate-binding protein n=1 Tax=Rhizobium tropici TaxID=398 RepID=A0A6P1C8P2_RHITR|nr:MULTISPECIES: transporter substrate-binding domain-containing protein [Rhizobium]AGB75382.1 ABC transporter, substrate-binding protein [Rhizobium tropici CIAT 899]MBB4241758.1 polar amino acid transport system substrate-binding protein [Rhizobium tropici]MBB5593595.1 polar amino acid transport system substrate-binding protein [Rhizobium tropici]MBB6492083.1 polar amino acid transport system substrate-binding protein [Rhizobium tropici]NEV13448.1 transporter substrate-binding domain-containi